MYAPLASLHAYTDLYDASVTFQGFYHAHPGQAGLPPVCVHDKRILSGGVENGSPTQKVESLKGFRRLKVDRDNGEPKVRLGRLRQGSRRSLEVVKDSAASQGSISSGEAVVVHRL